MTIRNILIAISLACTAVPSVAATADAIATVRVGDLDLTQADGRQRLDARLRIAARGVCETGLRGVSATAFENRCMSEAMARATPQVERAVAEALGGTQVALLILKASR